MNFQQFFTSNNWWGKILGAFFGYQIAGPVGALFGILVGNIFDRGLASHFNQPHLRYHQEKRQAVQRVFFEATFSVMGHITKADGRVSENEIAMAKILMEEMRLNHEQKNLAKKFFNEGKQATFDLASMLTYLQNTCRVNPELLKLFMDIQYRAAKTDGLTEPKIKALDTVFRRLGFAPLHKQYRFYEDFANWSQYSPFSSSGQSYQQSSSQQSSNRHYKYHRPQDSIAQAYAILEIPQTANKQEVKRAYRRLISKNHPDKLIAKGLPEQMIKMANDKTQKITKAYEIICENKGW